MNNCIVKSAVDDTFDKKKSFHVLQKDEEIFDFKTGDERDKEKVQLTKKQLLIFFLVQGYSNFGPRQ